MAFQPHKEGSFKLLRWGPRLEEPACKRRHLASIHIWFCFLEQLMGFTWLHALADPQPLHSG